MQNRRGVNLINVDGGIEVNHVGNWQWWTGVLIAVIIAGFTGFGVGYSFCNQTSKWLLDSTSGENNHSRKSFADAAANPAPATSSAKSRKIVLGQLSIKMKDHKS